ncbi:MAG: DNA polymerase III subunit delta', partial [Dysosmobacter sp.]|nr:DNA polymerase III subunit delta' [Dysosmobacter sp.]
MVPAASREDPVLSRLRAAAARGALSHALLFTGPGDRPAAARFAAAALQCTGPARSRPCGACPACRKVREDIHPDVTTVRDEAHKFLSVETIRELRRDAYIRPNEGARKVYIFPDCALLTEQDQNVLLKLVEEGPPYA